MSDWTIRPYEHEDESCIVSMWLMGYAKAKEVREAGLTYAQNPGSDHRLRYWRIHQPIVMGLLPHTEVRVACDPARSTNEPGAPAVIWAWSCVSDGVVHWVSVKHSVVQAGFGPDIVRDLLGDRLNEPQKSTFELVDLNRLRMYPEHWKRDRGWLASLRSMSTRALDDDMLYLAVCEHVMDTDREDWISGSERAA